MGKLFTEPLLLFCLIQAILIVRLFSDKNLNDPKKRRRMAWMFLGAFLVVYLPSLPSISTLLERGLDVRTGRTLATTDRVDIIAVLGAGFVRELNPNLDLVNDEGRSRLKHAAGWWKLQPWAKVVITGANAPDPERSSFREAELSKQFLLNEGIPENHIILETTATTTREHPTGILKLAGITPATKVGVVTSCWHMRRALREFRRYFSEVIPYPYIFEPIDWSDWTGYIPHRVGLSYSTTLLHEYIGSVWYEARTIFSPHLAE